MMELFGVNNNIPYENLFDHYVLNQRNEENWKDDIPIKMYYDFFEPHGIPKKYDDHFVNLQIDIAIKKKGCGLLLCGFIMIMIKKELFNKKSFVKTNQTITVQ